MSLSLAFIPPRYAFNSRLKVVIAGFGTVGLTVAASGDNDVELELLSGLGRFGTDCFVSVLYLELPLPFICDFAQNSQLFLMKLYRNSNFRRTFNS